MALFCPLLSMCQPLTLKGKILNEEGEPVQGATITLKRPPTPDTKPQTPNTSDSILRSPSSPRWGDRGGPTQSNNQGEFSLTNLQIGDTVTITAVGYEPQTLIINESYARFPSLTLVLKKRTAALDDVLVMAYGTTTRRLATGSISKVTAEDISRQPVYNPIAAIQGLVPGLLLAQRTGLPGSEWNIQLRGDNSLRQGSQPLFIIDGVPFTTNGNSLSQQKPDIQSIFNTLSPSDIQSIEVLKDADATAIYGSQGANGVVLITTKKGRAGTATFDVSTYTGWGRVARQSPLLNTPQYLAMRRKAFEADGRTITASLAPDLLVWDTTAYTNWQKEFTGGTARTTNTVASLSGGTATVTYRVGASYATEATVFPGARPVSRTGANTSLSFATPDKRFTATFSAFYAVDKKDLPFADLTAYILLPPNAPSLRDEAGNLRWTSGIDNPFSYLLETYRSRMAATVGNTSLRFTPAKGLSLGLNLGYNTLALAEEKQTPIAALRPSATATGQLRLTTGSTTSWIAEPQLSYGRSLGVHNFEALLGGSFQQREQTATSIQGLGYTTDDLLGSLGGAATLSANNSFTQYRYAAGFGRLSYNYRQKYLLNGNLRRDGSSRYGPASRFATFGSVGAAWNFSEEPWIKKGLPALSFGKLRASWGITGNDQLGDYQYFDAWTAATTYNYNGAPGILPSRLFNDVFQWEKVTKVEGAIELGFFANRLLLTVAHYRNRSTSQLLNYRLPSQTGFTAILRNIPAWVENTGTEIELTAKPLSNRSFSWQSTLNLSLPRNKLLRYPGLETSNDRFSFAIGYPLNLSRGYTFTGVDRSTGTYAFVDQNGDGQLTTNEDATHLSVIGSTAFGGWQNTFTKGRWQLSFLLYSNRQTGYTALVNVSAPPGFMRNVPAWLAEGVWQAPGDQAGVQQFTTLTSTPAGAAFSRYRSSSALVQDASFLRLRNLSLSWSLPEAWAGKARLRSGRLYIQAQNLLTITAYKGADPETQSLLSLPPLKILALGAQLTF
jgi:TonB-linked SusC/RagA family outer membrane protein